MPAITGGHGSLRVAILTVFAFVRTTGRVLCSLRGLL